MKTHIALFRGINVGGNCMLPMKELVNILEEMGLRNIKTYIQSGNAVFQSAENNSAELALKISQSIQASHGFAPQVLLLDEAALRQAITSNPFVEAEALPNTLHVNFLGSVPNNPDLQGLEKIKAANERFQLIGSVFYLHAPDGIGRSKLAARAEKIFGLPMTSRNWRTTIKLLELAST